MTVALIPTPVLAERRSQPGYSTERTCYKDVYREEYIPGTRNNPGRIKRYTDRVQVPCENTGARPNNVGVNDQSFTDDNSCIEGAVIGGIAGGAGGGVLATQENWIWSIPLGVIGGAMVGCQVDGG